MVENSSLLEPGPEKLGFEVLKGREALKYSTGTGLHGHINVSYEQLCKSFGGPEEASRGSYKKDVEWVLLFADGAVATIYNYKDGKNYRGSRGLEVVGIKDWHIGGNHGSDALERVQAILNLS